MGEFDRLLELPGTPQEQAWLKERLETLSVRERYALTAVTTRLPPEHTADAVSCIQNLPACTIHPAGSYEALGKLQLNRICSPPEDVLPYVDFDQIAQQYEKEHPGLFVGSYYVEYPKEPPVLARCKKTASLPEDTDWSVKLKLASPAVPAGVWLRLPGYDGKRIEESDEIMLALDELKVTSLDVCTLLEARCILPEAGDLMEQYDRIMELVQDGDCLGYLLDEQGQDGPRWLEKFSAALEYEDCYTLKFALDILLNLHCYEWVARDELKEFAANNLRSHGVPDELIQSGDINLRGYAENLLETSGYVETHGGTGYVTRNAQKFIREYTVPSWQDMREMNMQ